MRSYLNDKDIEAQLKISIDFVRDPHNLPSPRFVLPFLLTCLCFGEPILNVELNKIRYVGLIDGKRLPGKDLWML